MGGCWPLGGQELEDGVTDQQRMEGGQRAKSASLRALPSAVPVLGSSPLLSLAESLFACSKPKFLVRYAVFTFLTPYYAQETGMDTVDGSASLRVG